jgi:hypothetical protein
MMLPVFQLNPELSEIEFGKGSFSALEITYSPFQNRARPRTVASERMMKGDSQLNQSLNMLARRMVARRSAPNVFEFLVSVKETAVVE